MNTSLPHGAWACLGASLACHSTIFSNTVDSTSTIRLSDSDGDAEKPLTFDTGTNTPSRLVVQSGATADITIGIGQGPGTAVADVGLTSDLVIDHDGDGVLTFDADPRDVGGHTVTKTGSGELLLDNTVGGGGWFKLMLSEGTVRFKKADTFKNDITMNGGTLRWASGNTADISDLLVLSNGVSATFGTYGNDVEFGTDDIGDGTAASLVKMGAVTLYLDDATTIV